MDSAPDGHGFIGLSGAVQGFTPALFPGEQRQGRAGFGVTGGRAGPVALGKGNIGEQAGQQGFRQYRGVTQKAAQPLQTMFPERMRNGVLQDKKGLFLLRAGLVEHVLVNRGRRNPGGVEIFEHVLIRLRLLGAHLDEARLFEWKKGLLLLEGMDGAGCPGDQVGGLPSEEQHVAGQRIQVQPF